MEEPRGGRGGTTFRFSSDQIFTLEGIYQERFQSCCNAELFLRDCNEDPELGAIIIPPRRAEDEVQKNNVTCIETHSLYTSIPIIPKAEIKKPTNNIICTFSSTIVLLCKHCPFIIFILIGGKIAHLDEHDDLFKASTIMIAHHYDRHSR